MNTKINEIAGKIDSQEEKLLSEYAAKNSHAYRANKEKEKHYRPPYALDRDRILYSGAFRRYTGKTQVIYFVSLLDEQLTSRSLHTLSVAQIAKTIGRLLSLNTDLIEAIALGHDLGHPPFGHDGEQFLSKISEKHGIGQFHHNLQSLRVVDVIAKKGQGLNLTFQTRDGILSHNGEVDDQGLEPDPAKKEEDLQNFIQSMEKGEITDMPPATLEGCVVRLTDTIALGDSNGEIIETLVNDVVTTSHKKKYISFSSRIYESLYKLKKYNYQAIYKSPRLKVNHKRIEKGFEILFDHFLEALRENRTNSHIFTHFLNSKSPKYTENNPAEIKVRDFLAGMTDRYFSRVLEEAVVPQMTDFKIWNE